jgi:hypothetical protein
LQGASFPRICFTSSLTSASMCVLRLDVLQSGAPFVELPSQPASQREEVGWMDHTHLILIIAGTDIPPEHTKLLATAEAVGAFYNLQYPQFRTVNIGVKR